MGEEALINKKKKSQFHRWVKLHSTTTKSQNSDEEAVINNKKKSKFDRWINKTTTKITI